MCAIVQADLLVLINSKECCDVPVLLQNWLIGFESRLWAYEKISLACTPVLGCHCPIGKLKGDQIAQHFKYGFGYVAVSCKTLLVSYYRGGKIHGIAGLLSHIIILLSDYIKMTIQPQT